MRPRTPGGSPTGSRPKTRTVPAWALSRPSTWRISVVFPAPLAPTRPKTLPRGTIILTRFSAALAPKRRVTSRISMTTSLVSSPCATMVSLLLMLCLHDLIALANQLDDGVGVDVHLPGLGQEGVDPLRQDANALAAGQGRAKVGDVGAGGAAFLDDAGQ